ncbi:hypothetical protein I3843_05G133700 [Carya illinoinensis]|nr:hypothetical protein I3843_05G133700 [Carya illinoinensis]
MAEFLFLQFALDKLYFTPLGNFMDERDAAIREKLNSVKDTSREVKQLEEQAAAIVKAARAEISAALDKMKKEKQEELEEKLAEGRKKVEAELQEALISLEQQKEETIKTRFADRCTQSGYRQESPSHCLILLQLCFTHYTGKEGGLVLFCIDIYHCNHILDCNETF